MTFALSRTLRASDLDEPRVAALMHEVVGVEAAEQHRKSWEFALGVLALETGGVRHDDAIGLSVAAGHEAILYYLANRCRQIVATDIYELSDFRHAEASGSMLTDPDVFAPYPYRRGRLVVCWMDALDLRFEADSFDFVVSFGSIEHFGGAETATRALAEMARVVRPGGVVFVTTEQALDGKDDPKVPGTWLFQGDELLDMVAEVQALEFFGGIDLQRPAAADLPLVDDTLHAQIAPAGFDIRPHLGLRTSFGRDHREFTSVSLALRKVST